MKIKLFDNMLNTQTNIAPPPPPKDPLPPQLSSKELPNPPSSQSGENNLKRFSSRYKRESLTNSWSASVLTPRRNAVDKALSTSLARIDRSTMIDWDGCARSNPALEKHVRAMQQASADLNEMVKAKMTTQVQSLAEHITTAQENKRPNIEREAKEQTKKKLMETLGIKRSSSRKKRLAERDKIVQNKLNEEKEKLTTQVLDSISRLEQRHPTSLNDGCLLYFRNDDFKDSVPDALTALQKQLFEQADKAVSGELDDSRVNSFAEEPIFTTETPVYSVEKSISQPIIPQSASVFSTKEPLIIRSTDDSQQTLDSRPASFSGSTSTTDSTYDPRLNSSSGSKRTSTVSVQNSLDDKPAEISHAIDFFGGDELDSNIKDFLESGTLPDARRNDKGELEWIKKAKE